MNAMRRFTLSFAALNLVAAALVVFVTGASVGIHKSVMLDKYRELDLHGIINQKALGKYDGGRLAGGWTKVPDRLGEGEEDFVTLGWLIAAACVANSVVFMVIWNAGRKPDATATGKTGTATG
jgi:hypothetical protein